MQEFHELYQTYNRMIYQFLLKLTDFQEDLADELTQETFFQVYLSLPRYRGQAGILTWICSIAKHVCYKYYRKNPRMFSLESAEAEQILPEQTESSIQSVIEQKELVACTLKQIMGLKKKYRDVLVYRLYFEMSYAQIEALTGIKEATAKVIFHRGKEMVRKEVGDNYE